MTLAPDLDNDVTPTEVKETERSMFPVEEFKGSIGMIGFLDIHLVILQAQMHMKSGVQISLDGNYYIYNWG